MLQDTGRVSISHDLHEAYVFKKAIARLSDSEYWQKRKAEQDPDAEKKISALIAERERLAERRARVLKMYEDSDLTRTERRSRLDAIEAEPEQIGKDIQRLVCSPDIESAFGDRDKILAGWPKWTPSQCYQFLRLLIERVIVDEWPKSYSRTRPQFRNEPDEDYAAARTATLRESVERRVTIERDQ